MNRQLVVAGMHRSGTSLAASVLRAAGVAIGPEVNPGPGNPRGHFEDPAFHRLHEEMLESSGGVWRAADAGVVSAPEANFVRRGLELIAQRSHLPLWGWKDPRTCMFLSFWDALLPAANYLFTYRHVVDVALSLWRRGTDPELRAEPWLAIRAWTRYNQSILDFCGRHPERCFLAQVPALAADLPGLVRQLAARFELPLRDDGVAALWAPAELEPSADGTGVSWQELIPDALALYRLLEERADLPSAAAGAGVAAGDRALPAGTVEQRDRELLRAAEALLHDLLAERFGAGAPAGQHQLLAIALSEEQRQRALAGQALGEERSRHEELARALAEESHRVVGLRRELAAVRARHVQTAARLAEVSATLAAIESSRSFAPTRMWWRLRRHFGG